MACRGLDEARPRRGRKTRIKTAALTSPLQLVRVSGLDPGFYFIKVGVKLNADLGPAHAHRDCPQPNPDQALLTSA
jgi:hypothetical protein